MNEVHDPQGPLRSGFDDGAQALSGVADPGSGEARAPGRGQGLHAFEAGDDGAGPRYREIARLGEGGMGRVALVLDQRLKRQVARKIPRGQAAVARLAQEAWITAQLEHPGIVPIYDAGKTEGGDLFYTMRLVRGRSLEEVLAEHPGAKAASLAERLRVMRPFLAACEAVAFAHGAGVLHRDLKPHNIMLGEFGEAIVVDWGLARPVDGEAAWAGAELTGGQAVSTQAGEVVGTPSYMSPEQARPGREVDRRSDVWSLGAILYRIVAGHPPHPGADSGEVLAKAASQPVPPLERVAPEAPRELCAIAMRALAKAPEERYPDAKAFADDLAAWLDGRRVGAHAYTAMQLLGRLVRAWRVPLLVAAVGLVALVVLGLVAAGRVIDERDRAIAAEAKTREALRTSDESLGRALLAQARRHRDELERPEAEVLATEALRLLPWGEEAAEARGILAAFDGPRPRAVESRAFPSCTRPVVDGAVERLFCASDGALHDLRAQRVAWRAEGRATNALFHRDALWTVLASERLEQRAVATGEPRGPSDPAVGGTDRMSSQPSGPWSIWGWVAEDLERREVLQVCPKQVMVEAFVEVAGRLVSLCNDNTLHVLAPRGESGFSPLASLDLGTSARSVAALGTRLAVFSEQGRLLMVEVGGLTPRLEWSVETGIRTGVDVRFAPDGTRLALVAEGAGVSVVSAADGRALHRLPRRWGLGARWLADGLWTFGREAALRWALPEASEAIVSRIGVPGDPGLSSLSVGADAQGPLIALARGNGVLELVREDGLRVAQRRFGDKVVKRVAMAGDTVLVSAVAESQVLTLDLALAERERRGRQTYYRRVAPLADGRVLGAPYSSRVELLVDNGAVALEGALVAIDLDTDPAAREALAIDQAGTVARFDLATSRFETLGTWPLGTVVALDAEDYLVATPEHVVVLSRSLAERLRIAAHQVQDLECDGRFIALAERSGQTRVFDRQGALVATLGGHLERVAQVHLDREVLRSVSWDGTLRRYGLAAIANPELGLAPSLAASWATGVLDLR